MRDPERCHSPLLLLLLCWHVLLVQNLPLLLPLLLHAAGCCLPPPAGLPAAIHNGAHTLQHVLLVLIIQERGQLIQQQNLRRQWSAFQYVKQLFNRDIG